MQFWRVKWPNRTGISPTTNSNFTPRRHPLITTCCWHRDRFYIFIENQWCFKFQHFNRVSRKYCNRQVGLAVRRYLAEISLAKVIDEYAGWLQTVFFVWVIFMAQSIKETVPDEVLNSNSLLFGFGCHYIVSTSERINSTDTHFTMSCTYSNCLRNYWTSTEMSFSGDLTFKHFNSRI